MAINITNSDNATLITGTSENDTINNSGNNVTVDADNGDNSIVYAYTENGSISAGTDNDNITAIESANIYINAGAGDNYVFNGYTYYDADNNLVYNEGSNTSSTIITGAGDDTVVNWGIYSGSINAGDGDNYLNIYNSYSNTINTGNGADYIDVARSGSLSVYTGEGNDSIIGSLSTLQNDTMDNWAFGNNATIDAGAGNDYISTHYSSNSSIFGGAGNDTIINNGENTTIDGGAGNDYIELTNNSTDEYEAAVIVASAGDDTIVGATSNTSIQGTFTASTVNGSNVILTTSSGTLTVNDAAGQTLNINGAESVIGGDSETTNTLAAYLADFMLHKTSAGYPQMAALAFNPTEENPDPPTNYYSSETWTATSADNLTLSAVHYSPENPTGKWVILVHGYGKVGASMNTFAAPYLNLGVDVLIVDQRAAGNSEGDWLTMGVAESADIAVWTQEITNTNSNAQITLHGVSMGAATVMLAAALSQTQNITAIIEDCGYSDISTVLSTLLTAYSAAFGITGDIAELVDDTFEVGESLTGYDVAQAAPIDVIAQVTVPSLFIHGAADEAIPVSNATTLYNAVGSSNKTLVTIEGAGHAQSGIVDSVTYLAAVTDLLEDSTAEIGAAINSSVDNSLIRGTIYDDTISATGSNVSIDGISGNDTVSYSATANILFDFETATVDGDNVILTSGDNSITILDAKNQSLILNGNQTVIGDDSTAQNISNADDKSLITGTSLDDTISNSGSKVTIDAAAGNDSITNSGARSSIIGGAGNDSVSNNAARVTVNAGDGNNSVTFNGAARGSVVAGSGNDSITAIESDKIYINAGDGDNYVFNAFAYYDEDGNFIAKNDNPNKSTRATVIGGAGNDTLINQGINYAKVDAGEGDNVIGLYHSYYNTITTGSGADSVVVDKGHTLKISTGAGNDSIIGRVGDIEEDSWAFGGYATLDAGAGDDYIAPLYSNNSSIVGGAGNDTIINNGANTTINGGDGNDYIELTDSSTGEFEAAVIVASKGNDTIKNYSSVVTLQGEFTNSFYSGNDVLLKTSDGYLTVIDGKDQTFNINGTESVIGGDNSMEVITNNGILYTLQDGAELTYDSSGNVTGIASGTVTAELDGAETTPVITLDGSTPFTFTAEAMDGGLKLTQGSNSFVYVSGAATYSANSVYFPAGDISLKLSNATLSALLGAINVTIPSGGLEIPFDSSGVVTINLPEELTASVSGGTASGSVTVSGEIIYDAANKQITLGEGASVATSDLAFVTGATPLNFSITALAETILAIEGSGLASNFVFKDGASVSISGSTFGLTGDLALSGGDLSVSFLQLIAGQVSSLTLTEGATLDADIEGLAPASITAPADSSTYISIENHVISINSFDENGINVAIGDLSALSINIKGIVKLDNANQTITLTEGTVATVEMPGGATIQITANADATAALAINSDGSISLTPQANDGTLQIAITNTKGEAVLDAELEATSGTLTYNPSTNHVTIGGGTEAKLTIGDYTFTTSNTEDAGGTISVDASTGGITYTPDTGDGILIITVEGTGESQFENVGVEVLSGSFTLFPTAEGNSLSVAQGTELKLDFSETYSITFKATDAAGGIVHIIDEGISFTPGENDGSLELTVTNGETTRTASLEMTGTVIYTLGGAIQLTEGTVVKNVFEDGKELTITANSDSGGTITFNPEGGLTITPATSNSFSLTTVLGPNVSINFDTVEGTFTYSGGVITTADGTSLKGQAYRASGAMTFDIEMGTTDGESSLDCSTSGIVFIPGENATLHGNLSLSGTDSAWEFNITEGSMKIGFSASPILTEGTVITGNFDSDMLISLETAGTYTLNGNEITTTADGVQVYLTNGDTVTFDADAAIAVEGYSFGGEGTVSMIDGDFTLGAGSTLTKTFESGNVVTITANADLTGCYSPAVLLMASTETDSKEITINADGSITVAPATADAVSVTYTTSNAAVTYETIDGSITYGEDTVTLADGTESTATCTVGETSIAFDFAVEGGSSSATITENDITYALEEGATLTAKINDNTTVLSAGTMRSLLDGSATYLSDGANITTDFDAVYTLETAGTYTLNGQEITTEKDNVEFNLVDGALIFELGDDRTLTITPNTENAGEITVDADGGVKVTPTAADSMGVSLDVGNNVVHEYTSIEGALTFNGTYIYFDADTQIEGNVLVNEQERPFHYEVEGSGANLNLTLNANVITVEESGTTLTGEVNNAGSLVITGEGAVSIELDDSRTYHNAYVSEGINLTSAAGEYHFIMPTSGSTYNLNGYELTATKDNVTVYLTNHDTVTFEADAGVSYDGNEISGVGEVTISDGEISLVMYEAGTATFGGKEFTLTEAAPDGVTISVNGNVIEISHVISAAEIESLNLSESAIGKTMVESVEVTGDDSYAVRLVSTGISALTEISSGANIKATVTIDGETFEDGTTWSVRTDSTGTVTLGDKSYNIQGDDSVLLFGEFASDGTYELKDVELLVGEISGDFNGTTSINGAEITISDGADNALITAFSNFKYIENVNDGASVTAESAAVDVQNSMTINEITYNVSGDSDGVFVEDKEVFALDENASLTVSENGNYTVNSTPLEVTTDDVVVGLNRSFAYILTEEAQIQSTDSTEEILDAFGVDESDAKIIPASATGNQRATIPSGGGVAIVEDTKAPVTIVGGSGDDTVVSKGDDVVFNMVRGGDDKVMVLDGNIKIENYNPRTNAGIQLTAEDMQAGVKFNDGTIELANGTVELSNNFVNLYDIGGNKDLIGFATNEDKRVDASSQTEGISIIGGGENASNNVSNATLIGGSGNDSIYAGEKAHIKPGEGNDFIQLNGGNSTIDYGGGNDTIDGFNFADSSSADKLQKATITDVDVNYGDVILTTEDGEITVNDAENKDIALDKDVTLQVGDDELIFDGVANQYWATGDNATVKLDETYTSKTVPAINLDEMKGSVKDVDAAGYEGTASITGNSGDNVITASAGGSTLDGGEGNDSLKGGAGVDEFISASGDDTINGFEFGTGETADKLNAGENAISKVKVDNGNVILTTENGSVEIEDAAGQTVQFKSEKTNNETIAAQFADTAVTLNDEANFYWAGGNSATVDVDSELDTKTKLTADLSNADYNNASKLSFAGDIKEINASGFDGTADLSGNSKNNVITASAGGSTLNGGERNDKLVGGAGADTFVYEQGNGKDTVSNFEFGTEKTSDVIDLTDVAVKSVKVYDDDVILEVDGGFVKVEGGAGETIQIKSEHTNNKAVAAQFAANDLAINDEANFYWAANKNATLTVTNYSASTIEIDLSNSDYNNADQLSFAGKIRTVDASSYKGYARITGNDLNNVLIAGNKGANLWGGAGNDTLIGGDDNDTFIYSGGNDVIQNASDGDTVYLKGFTLDDIKKVDATDSSINLKFKNSGTLSIATDSPEKIEFSTDNESAYTYTYNRETKSFDAHEQGCY